MKEEYLKAKELIEEYDTIIIHRHSNPDGDAIGSQIGLKAIIELNYPEKDVYVVGDELGRYSFMYNKKMDNVETEVFKKSLSIVLDTSSPSLISDDRYTLAKETLRFDHHLFIEKFCDIEIIDSSRESCASLVADFAYSTGLKVDSVSAKSLFTGIVTDSGRFLYDSVSPSTFTLCSYLLSTGFSIGDIYASLYNEDFASLKRRGYFIDKIKVTDSSVAYAYITKEDVEKMGTTPFSISRGFVNTMANIKGVGIWVSFTEDEDGILCELRSRDKNINPIAVKYGGGGHKKASGAKVKSKEEAMMMLDDLNKEATINEEN